VNEKNKFVPAKEVNGFRFEGALQRPFGDDVSSFNPMPQASQGFSLLSEKLSDCEHLRDHPLGALQSDIGNVDLPRLQPGTHL
jgi:hypothetical protein